MLSAPLWGAVSALSCRRGDLCLGSRAGSRAVVEAHGCETAGTAGGGAGPGSQAWRVQPGLPSHARLQSPEQGLGALSLGPGRSDPHGEGPGARLSGLAALSAVVLPSGPWVLQRLSRRQRLGSSSLAFFLSMSSKHAPRFHVYTRTAPDPDLTSAWGKQGQRLSATKPMGLY